MSIISKQQINGSISPRWPKSRVVKWMEWGAIPAILGLWLPDWSGGYIQLIAGDTGIRHQWQAFPPVLTFIGALILFKACAEGVRNMGWHYKGVLISGWTAIAFAGLSVILHFFISDNPSLFGSLTILSIGLAAFYATGFLWFTISKVAEISSETRTQITRDLVLWLAIAALISGAGSVILIYLKNPVYVVLLRLTVVLFTIVFGLCRYGVYCYKTQKSIGAGFTTPPNEQFWI